MTFDVQWRYVIGIPCDLFLNTAVKVKMLVVKEAPIGSNQSECSKISLDQSASSI